MRLATAFNKLLRLPGVSVTAVAFEPDRVIVDVRLQQQRLTCPKCDWSTAARHNLQPGRSTWRSLDLGAWRGHRPRPATPPRPPHLRRDRRGGPTTPATTPASPAISRRWSPGEATKMDATAVSRLTRIAWPGVGKIIDRVTADEIDPARLEQLYEIGVDEISPKKHHNCLTVAVNHCTGQVAWTEAGKDTAAADRFFAELGPPAR